MIDDGTQVDFHLPQDHPGQLRALNFILTGDGIRPVQAEAGIDRPQEHHAQPQGDQNFQQRVTPATRVKRGIPHRLPPVDVEEPVELEELDVL